MNDDVAVEVLRLLTQGVLVPKYMKLTLIRSCDRRRVLGDEPRQALFRLLPGPEAGSEARVRQWVAPSRPSGSFLSVELSEGRKESKPQRKNSQRYQEGSGMLNFHPR